MQYPIRIPANKSLEQRALQYQREYADLHNRFTVPITHAVSPMNPNCSGATPGATLRGSTSSARPCRRGHHRWESSRRVDAAWLILPQDPDSPGDNEEAMTPKLLVAAFLLNVGSLSAVELRGVVVESTEGTFLINNLKVDGSGTDQSFRVKWNGLITNNTGKEWHKVTFCGKGFEAEDKPLLAAGEPCLLRLWMYAWKPGAQMRWKGSEKMRLADGKRRVALARMEWSVSEILTDPESVLIFPQTCSRVWSAGMKVFVDSKFRPTVSDKDSFIASFEYTGGHTVAGAFGNTNQLVKAYTATKIGWLTTWDAFRIESAGLMLRPGPKRGMSRSD